MTITSNNVQTNTQTVFIKAAEIAELMEVSRTYAYGIIRQLNGELEAKGFITIDGRTNRKYFYERIYYTASI